MPEEDEDLFSDGDEEELIEHSQPRTTTHPHSTTRTTHDSRPQSWFLRCLQCTKGLVHVDTTTVMTVAERERMQQYQTLDYISRYSTVAKTALEEGGEERYAIDVVRWLLFFAVGVSVGLVAFVMRQTIDFVTDHRLAYVAALLRRDPKELFPAWLFLVGTGISLILFSSAIVVYLWRPARGSGIEEVIAYLNGVEMPKVLNVRTGVVKILSCIAAVSSGLPCGPEGPVIHLGAICGAGLTQGRSTSLGCNTRFLRRFRNASDHRDFITAGSAAGISAAFGAPIGGLLFVMEEMSTHWKPSLTLNIFFTSLAAFSTVSLFNSAFDAWEPTGTFGSFLNKAAVLFEVKTIIQLNILAIFPAFLVGTLGGLFGACFTVINVKINMWRRRCITPYKYRCVLEPIVVLLVFSTISLLLPFAFECRSFGGGVSESSGEKERWVTEDSKLLATFVCDSVSEYSPLGTLTLSGNEGTIRRLFSRGTDNEFGMLPLAVYFTLYFAFACYTAGMSISSGLLVPLILMGAVMGRLVGHILVVTIVNASYVTANQWIDPGVFALIGAGAFVGGVSRMTVALVVIMLEISGELHFLLPIMLAVITAGWSANFFTPSLYHCYLEMRNVPIMPLQRESHGIDLARHCALEAVAAEPLCFKEKESILKICETLKLVRHNCFPVVSEAGLFQGTILRRELEILLRSPEAFGEGAELTHEQLCGKEEEAFLEKKANVNWLQRIADGDLQRKLNLLPYVNKSPFTVQAGFSLDLTYDLFTSLGLRHLIVIKREKCMGIITRKDLLEATLEERLGPGALNNYYSSNRPEWYGIYWFFLQKGFLQFGSEKPFLGLK